MKHIAGAIFLWSDDVGYATPVNGLIACLFFAGDMRGPQ